MTAEQVAAQSSPIQLSTGRRRALARSLHVLERLCTWGGVWVVLVVAYAFAADPGPAMRDLIASVSRPAMALEVVSTGAAVILAGVVVAVIISVAVGARPLHGLAATPVLFAYAWVCVNSVPAAVGILLVVALGALARMAFYRLVDDYAPDGQHDSGGTPHAGSSRSAARFQWASRPAAPLDAPPTWTSRAWW